MPRWSRRHDLDDGRGRLSGARLLKLNDEVHEKILEQLASGCTLEVAARAAGVGRRTLLDWLARGRNADAVEEEGRKLGADEARLLRLLQDADQVRAQVEVRALATIRTEVVEGSWQAAAWYLERVAPERYAAGRTGGCSARE
jgi:hypothetical protein